jgi:RNA polymerase sigma-70 factor, ECF subfamily
LKIEGAQLTIEWVMSSASPTGEATVLLDRLRAGDADAGRELLPILYDELRQIAARQFKGQRADHTLQPTVLVHEAFLRLVGKPATAFADRAHFFAVAATAMRQILVNHARASNTQKRGGGGKAVGLEHDVADSGEAAGSSGQIDVLALHEALEKLANIDERKHRIIELRFFAGLTVDEIAQAMGLSKTTIESEWRAARAWLNMTLR